MERIRINEGHYCRSARRVDCEVVAVVNSVAGLAIAFTHAPMSAEQRAQARAKGGTASGSARTGTARTGTARTGTASRPATSASPPASGQNGTGMRGLLRLGRAKAEPEPQDDMPAAKVVRQQPVRPAKSKRSGKR